MDLPHIESVLVPRDRAGLIGLDQRDGVLAGGTWLMSQPQPGLRRLVDLAGLGWNDLEPSSSGLEIAATCTIENLIAFGQPEQWPATALFAKCARVLLASFKIWHSATVGGNVCLALPAGAMISLCSALDADLLIWRGDGSDEHMSVTDFVTGVRQTELRSGDVLRSIHLPDHALRQQTAMRAISYAALGRSAVVVIGRRSTPETVALSVSAATTRPYVIRVDAHDLNAVASRVESVIEPSSYYLDAHGTPEWRRAMTLRMCREVVAELVA